MMVCDQSPGVSVFLDLDKAASATAYSVRVIAIVTAISILTCEQYLGQCGVKKREKFHLSLSFCMFYTSFRPFLSRRASSEVISV